MKHTNRLGLPALVCCLALMLTLIPPVSAVSVTSRSMYHSLAIGAAIRKDGSLFAWGPGLNRKDSTPTDLGTGFVSVTRYSNTFLALKDDGTLWTWGELPGGGTTWDRPTYLTGDVREAEGHAVLKNDGSVWSLLPIEGMEDQKEADHLYWVMDGAAQVTTAGDYGAALKINGTVWTWYPKAGDEDAIASLAREGSNLPGQIANEAKFVRGNMFLKEDSTLWAWGSDTFGMSGNGNGEDRSAGREPVQVRKDMANAWFNGNLKRGTCFSITSKDRVLYSWGYNQNGSLGYTESNQERKPDHTGGATVPYQDTPKEAGLKDVMEVEATDSITLVLLGDNTVWACGKNSGYAVPDSKEERYETWTQVMEDILLPGRNSASAPTDTTTVTATVSGSLDLPQLTQEQIVKQLNEGSLNLPDTLYSQDPSTRTPYAAGALSDSALKAAVGRLNALRRLAGLPAAKLDDSLNDMSQKGAVLLASNRVLTHYPTQPSAMRNDFFQDASTAVAQGNIAMGYSLTYAIDNFMGDIGASNIPTAGHRRWQLNPEMGKVGFGMAGDYMVEYAFDRSAEKLNYDFISWPASGNFPSSLAAFQPDSVWTITLNPEKYAIPNRSDITVSVVQKSTKRSWAFSGNYSYTAADSGRYFNFDTSNYGIPNCIVFRPSDITAYEGDYQVTVTGLKTIGGTPAKLEYTVSFFDPSPSPSFSDVPWTHWANPAVEQAASLGLVNGMGDGLFAPDDSMSTAYFSAMLTRSFYSDALDAAGTSSSPWWQASIDVSRTQGLLRGTALERNEVTPEDPIGRYDMAQMTYNLLVQQKKVPDQTAILTAQSQIADWSAVPAQYQPAVAACYAAGLITGYDAQGTFQGTQPMTRAQACTLLCRILG